MLGTAALHHLPDVRVAPPPALPYCVAPPPARPCSARPSITRFQQPVRLPGSLHPSPRQSALAARLLAYAALSPASLGGGLAYLGSSYGAMRLALLLSLVGLFTHLSLVHKLGEDQVVAMLDTLRGHWGHMARYQQMVQLLLVVALACTYACARGERRRPRAACARGAWSACGSACVSACVACVRRALLWIRRVEWSALLLLYGLWAHIEHHHDHLSFFSSAVIFSMCTDALALAADAADSPFIEAVTWVLLGCKLVVVVTLIYQRDAFV